MEAEVKQVIKEKEYVHGEDRKEYMLLRAWVTQH